MQLLIAKTFARSRPFAVIVSLVSVLLIGWIDYFAGSEISISLFYLLPIAIAAWFVGSGWASVICFLSVLVSVLGDFAVSTTIPNGFILFWNGGIVGGGYFLFVWLMTLLKSSQEGLETKVLLRTSELSAEMEQRKKLEEELISASEMEQQRIGHDLHDCLCQHLTATALAGQVLEEKLVSRSSPEVPDARHLVELIEAGIDLARSVARGLFPSLLEKQGLMSALHELAAATKEHNGVECFLDSDAPVIVHDSNKAIHLFRIAQEAVRNAVKHSGARKVTIKLSEQENGMILSVEDDGCGMNYSSGLPAKGMGLQIMRHRTELIGGSFGIISDSGGTIVTCLHIQNSSREEH